MGKIFWQNVTLHSQGSGVRPLCSVCGVPAVTGGLWLETTVAADWWGLLLSAHSHSPGVSGLRQIRTNQQMDGGREDGGLWPHCGDNNMSTRKYSQKKILKKFLPIKLCIIHLRQENFYVYAIYYAKTWTSLLILENLNVSKLQKSP